jgi:hypothetical protein
MKTFSNLLLAGAFACTPSTQPVVTMVMNRTSYSAVVSPGSWVIIAGYIDPMQRASLAKGIDLV